MYRIHHLSHQAEAKGSSQVCRARWRSGGVEREVRALEPIRGPRQLSHRDAAVSRGWFPRQETQRAGGSTASLVYLARGGLGSTRRLGSERACVCVCVVCGRFWVEG